MATSKRAARNSRFQKGSGVFTCDHCGKKTRATGGNDNEHVGLCTLCYDCGGDENALSDGTMTQAEFDAEWPVGSPHRADTVKTTVAAVEPTPIKHIIVRNGMTACDAIMHALVMYADKGVYEALEYMKYNSQLRFDYAWTISDILSDDRVTTVRNLIRDYSITNANLHHYCNYAK